MHLPDSGSRYGVDRSGRHVKVMATDFAPWFLLAMALSAVWIGWLVVLIIKMSKGPDRAASPPPPWTPPS